LYVNSPAPELTAIGRVKVRDRVEVRAEVRVGSGLWLVLALALTR